MASIELHYLFGFVMRIVLHYVTHTHVYVQSWGPLPNPFGLSPNLSLCVRVFGDMLRFDCT